MGLNLIPSTNIKYSPLLYIITYWEYLVLGGGGQASRVRPRSAAYVITIKD